MKAKRQLPRPVPRGVAVTFRDVARRSKTVHLTSVAQVSNVGIGFIHIGRGDTTANIDDLLKSKYVSHILFYVGNRHDSDWILTDESLLIYGIAACKTANKKSIVARNLWPTTSATYDSSILTSASYYAGEIAAINTLKTVYGFDYTAFDTEAYGGEPNPVEDYLSWADDYHPTDEFNAAVSAAVATATASQGTVDFVYPCGGVRTYSLFNLLDSLGTNGILESTYYNKTVSIANQTTGKDLKTIWLGVYLNTTAENGANPYYLPSEVPAVYAARSDYAGLFLYPKEDNVDAVIAALLEI